jgi:hypothetical protein
MEWVVGSPAAVCSVKITDQTRLREQERRSCCVVMLMLREPDCTGWLVAPRIGPPHSVPPSPWCQHQPSTTHTTPLGGSVGGLRSAWNELRRRLDHGEQWFHWVMLPPSVVCATSTESLDKLWFGVSPPGGVSYNAVLSGTRIHCTIYSSHGLNWAVHVSR